MNPGAAVMPMNEAPSLPRVLLPALLGVALLAGAVLLAHALRPLLDRPVQALRVDGALTHLKVPAIAAAAAIPPGTGLFDVDLGAVRDRVEALPWVARARVSRVWPGRIAVRVWERQPFARWGDAALVDSDGVAFTPPPAELPAGLPLLAGPPGRAGEVMQAYQELGARLQGSPFVPAGLRLDARGEWTLQTAGGIELRLGDAAPASRVPLLLGAVWHSLADRMDQVAYVDLRYSNGFAVAPKADKAACPQWQGNAAGAHPRKPLPGCDAADAAAAPPAHGLQLAPALSSVPPPRAGTPAATPAPAAKRSPE